MFPGPSSAIASPLQLTNTGKKAPTKRTMTRRQFLTSTVIAGAASAAGAQASVRQPNVLVGDRPSQDPKPVYELRVYTVAPGKQIDLMRRFQTYTSRFFERYRIHEEGYWVPTNPDDSRLFFLLRYPSRAARDRSWEEFMNDPVWQLVHKDSEQGGAIVTGVESHLLSRTDYSKWTRFKGALSNNSFYFPPKPGVFELRTYTTPDGLLPHLDRRFRNHTMRLFEKHGMRNWLYFHKLADQPGADNTLLYFLTHDSETAAARSFDSFRKDPQWAAVRQASEKAAGGSLTVPNGVQSVFLKPVVFSPTK
jgi:hypothetical protein